MTNESDRFWNQMIAPLQNLDRLPPSTPDEAQAEFDAAGEIPLSERRIQALATRVMAMVEEDSDQSATRLAPEASYGSAERTHRKVLQDPSGQRPRRSIMHGITVPQEAAKRGIWTSRIVRYAMAAAAMIALVVGLQMLFQQDARPGPAGGISAFTLLAQASAAEANLFAGQDVVRLRNQIVVTPVANESWAKMRWLPLVSLQATGQPRFHQVTLSAEVNKGYTVEDRSWYDPRTGRFARALTCDGRTIFASAYDGLSVHTFEPSADGKMKVVSHQITKDFQPPQNLAAVLGIGAGLQSGIDSTDTSMVQNAGKTVLEDGAQGHLLKLNPPQSDAIRQESMYWLVTIRTADNRIEKMEWRSNQQPLLVICRAAPDGEPAPAVGWDLSGLTNDQAATASGPAIRNDLVIPGISLEQMAAKASFPVYVFGSDPAWIGHSPIIDDVLDIISPPKRMFMTSYPAKDGRHVVLVQSAGINANIGPTVRQGALSYTSRSGVKVWDGGPRGPWLARILLQSARHNLKDAPADDLTGYVLETPDRTYPMLAVNGKLTEEELHALVDSLVPADSPRSQQH